ncbi:MAG TPA: OmpA family protein [Anaeromyxobacteraceae bacterium]|jgi:outer membrane protein OmpA-like peptidoglycan-associated protein|nr:OmpA family protein [Anaeromyxobacteraceae bacterium]
MRGAIGRLLLAGLLATGCASESRLRADVAATRAETEKVRRNGGERCNPREIARAEAALAFADRELDQGNSGAAEDHLDAAHQNLHRASVTAEQCAPKTVTVREKAEKPAVIIEKADRDGDGVPDLDDACPDVPGPKENQGCPLVKDSDGDGIPDDVDKCPFDPEDKDGFQDEDGCPDPDNDHDGVVDAMDACPNNPGPIENQGCPVLDRDGDGIVDWLDKCPDVPGVAPDGCPRKFKLIEVKKDRIEIRQQVHFATGRFKVLKDSFPLLDQVVQALADMPRVRVRIEGHTDTVGGAAANLKLSQKRAEAVRAYLVKKGIDGARLDAVGYGPNRPLASNRTEKGRAQNRRTEFRIVAEK